MRRHASQIIVTFTLAALLAGIPGIWPRQAEAAAPDNSSSAALAARREAVLVDLLMARRRLLDVGHELETASRQLQQAEERLTEVEVLENRAEADYQTVSGRFAERTRETYKQGRTGWLEVLVGSDDLSDFLSRLDLLGKVLDDESRLIREVAARRQELAAARADLERARGEQAEVVRRLDGAREELRQAEGEKQALADRLGEQLRSAEEAARRAEAKMAAMNQSPSGPVGSRGSSSQGAAGSPNRGGRAGASAPQSATTSSAPPESASATAGKELRVKATAYCLPGTTATGVPVGRGIIAVDPRIIPLGTRIFVPGYGEGIAADTGGAVKGNFIDVWLPEGEAEAWGVKYLTITILG